MSAAADAGATSSVAWYVYGVTEADAQAPVGEAGVANGVEALREGALTALVSRVALEEFGEEPVRARLDDPAWLAEKARAHEAVLSAALRSGAVLPFRFLTIYSREDELRRFLTTRGADLRAVLERVRGRVELGVKAFVERGTLELSLAGANEALAKLDAEIEQAQAGRAYLLQRRRDEAVREDAAHVLLDIVHDSHERLLGVAESGVANPVQSPELSGRQGEMVLNGAYLVPLEDSRFGRELGALRERYGQLGITFEQTGPWPPYNFVPSDLGER